VELDTCERAQGETQHSRSGQARAGELEAENERLRRELANTKMDPEIVNKAALFAK
jgi:hypothetical protein